MKVSSIFQSMKGKYLQIWFHSVFIALLALVPFIYMLQVSTRVYNSRSWETLFFLTALTLALLMIWTVLHHFRGRALFAIGLSIDADLRQGVFDAVHRGNTPEAFRAYADLGTVRQVLTGPLIELLMDAVLAPIFIAVLFVLHPAFGGLALLYIAALALLGTRARRIDHEMRKCARAHEDQAFAFGIATAARREAIRAQNILPGVRREWINLETKAAKVSLEGEQRTGVLESAIHVLQQSQMVLTMGLGAVLYLLDKVSPADGMAAFLVMTRGIGPALSLARNWSMINEFRVATTRISALLASVPPSADLALPPMVGRVSCENLGLAGSDGKPILSGIRFDVPAGSIVGVIGPSGAGKSSLLRVLSGAMRPDTGTVRIDGFPIEQWPEAQHGDATGYLPQEMDLLPGTIWQNVTRFAPFDPSRSAEVTEALRRAGALDIVQARGRGLGFQLQDGGVPLSGGQRQRIALARAFYGKPRVIILDEPNSALDAEAEARLIETMLDLGRSGSTIFFSTHKSNMLGCCDYILVIMDGYMHSFATRDEILWRLRAAGNPLLQMPPQDAPGPEVLP
ncbi:ATP-binding cassette subfamily C exporter for protease/lipase/ATP-binding cassette subfamily C protein EexD [Rhodobacter viridis]|uniref:ATP-binding cassette subfamily C exporter for protease/lipase/ATP-binding cassette subfamily C protein EexD n=2 Tax=Rhodobacter viridis TaxID=1054202 RepID=A0A318U690_9RHOB|nr:ATP-binding cassette subfamily C exporter for protease/lipase/ATP-binding cassette subfamily C protein EexD [Rhodobacter viridis]